MNRGPFPSRNEIRPASPVGVCIAVRLGGDEPAADWMRGNGQECPQPEETCNGDR